MAAKKGKAPWDKPNPQSKRSGTRKLSNSQKATAKRSAKKAGRPYPNLVDNMRAAAKGKTRKKSKS